MMKELYISPEATVVSFVPNQNIAAGNGFDTEIPFDGLTGALLQGATFASATDIELELW